MSRSKAKGTAFETGLVNYLRANGWEVERLTLQGSADEGDLYVREDAGVYSLIEAKATQALTPAVFVKEALTERDNFARRRKLDPRQVMPIVVWKSPGKGIGDALCIIPLKEMFPDEES